MLLIATHPIIHTEARVTWATMRKSVVDNGCYQSMTTTLVEEQSAVSDPRAGQRRLPTPQKMTGKGGGKCRHKWGMCGGICTMNNFIISWVSLRHYKHCLDTDTTFVVNGCEPKVGLSA